MEQYKAMLEGLRDVPKQAPEGSMTMVTDNIRLDMLSVANGIASVDVSAADGAGALSGGSLEELLFIEQITFSLIESFEEIQEVAFLVEGKAADTLMGQMDISEPFNKDSFSGNGI
jgi:spore germination protein GerM